MKQLSLAVIAAFFMISCGETAPKDTSEEAPVKIEEEKTEVKDTEESKPPGVTTNIRLTYNSRYGRGGLGKPDPNTILLIPSSVSVDQTRNSQMDSLPYGMFWEKMLVVQLDSAPYQCWLYGFYVTEEDSKRLNDINSIEYPTKENPNVTQTWNFQEITEGTDSVLVSMIVFVPGNICKEGALFNLNYTYGTGKEKKSSRKFKSSTEILEEDL